MSNEKLGSVNFDQLAGLEAALYYNNKMNQFQLGSVVFEVIEDESDGYRSSMEEVKIIQTEAERRPGDFLANVIIEKVFENDFDGYHLIGKEDSHIWLTFGTDNCDDYYSSFRFYFESKPGTTLEQQK